MLLQVSQGEDREVPVGFDHMDLVSNLDKVIGVEQELKWTGLRKVGVFCA